MTKTMAITIKEENITYKCLVAEIGKTTLIRQYDHFLKYRYMSRNKSKLYRANCYKWQRKCIANLGLLIAHGNAKTRRNAIIVLANSPWRAAK